MFNIITTQKGWIYMSMEKNNNIVIVEDDVLSRITLKKMINNQQVCADFDNAQDCFDYIKLHNNVDLIIMDATLPYLNGIQASKIIKKYNKFIKIMILTPYHSELQVIKTLYANADAYFIRDFGQEYFNKIINRTLAGTGGIDKRIQYSLLNFIKLLPQVEYFELINKLSDNEYQFISLFSKGFSKNEIAKSLNMPVHYLCTFVYSILDKLTQIVKLENFGREIIYDLH